jgi:hypothetical protein
MVNATERVATGQSVAFVSLADVFTSCYDSRW